MAADGSFTQMIFFIAAIVVAVSVSGVLIGMSASMAQELKVKSDAVSQEMATEIKIINDPRHVPYSDGNLTLYLKNTGDISLNYNNIVMLIDGQYINNSMVVSPDTNGSWLVGVTLQMDLSVQLSAGDHEVKAVMPNGVYATMSFRA